MRVELNGAVLFIARFRPPMKDDATYQTLLFIGVLAKSKLVISGIIGNPDVLVFLRHGDNYESAEKSR